VIWTDERFVDAERHNLNNALKIIAVLGNVNAVWFSDLQESVGISSVCYFRRSLKRLIRKGVVVEVKPGLYSLSLEHLALYEWKMIK